LIRKAFRNIISISRWSLIALSIFPISSAKADTNPIITEPTDFWFSYAEPTQFLAQTYQSDGFESDPQLWLYNADTGQEIASNDDYFGLQSKIDLAVPAGNYRLRAATCCGDPNAWRDGVVWNIKYELSFNGNPVNTTTTTEVTTSLPPEVPTTTTLPELPTTTSSTTTETPTTWPENTTSTEPTTTTTTIAPTTTAPVMEVTTTTTVVDTVAPSTTPTTSPSVTIVEPPQTSLAPSTTLSPFFPTPLTTLPETTTTTPETPTETTETPTTTVPEEETIPEEEIVIPDSPTSEEINELADELVSSITELSDEEITNLVESIDVSELTEESISAVFSEEVLNELSDDQVTELIDAIVPSELSDDQALALSEALTDAPDNVKQEFEQQIDVFGGQFDTYVATGSAVSVGARRVLVAAAVAAFAMPIPTSSSRKQ
jgi:hypothetical protein